MLALWLLISYALFYKFPLAEPQYADAVVVLGGASTERLPAGQKLVSDGWAPTLVLSRTDTSANAEADRLCRRPGSERVICFRPVPRTTRGEARAIARLVADEGWNRVLVVTSHTMLYVRTSTSANAPKLGSSWSLLSPTSEYLVGCHASSKRALAYRVVQLDPCVATKFSRIEAELSHTPRYAVICDSNTCA